MLERHSPWIDAHRPFSQRVAMTPATPYEHSGTWDSIHVFETAERGRQAHYKLTSTVMLQLVTKRSSEAENVGAEKKSESKEDAKTSDGWKREGEVNLSGSMTRQVSLMSPLIMRGIFMMHQLSLRTSFRRSKIGLCKIAPLILPTPGR